MSGWFEIDSPASGVAGELASDYGLSHHGLLHLDRVYWNLPEAALYEEIVFRKEGHILQGGPLVVSTVPHSARAAQDKFVVLEDTTAEDVWWGEHNRPIPRSKFHALLGRVLAYLEGEEVFVQDCWAGAHPEHRLPVRIVTERAWHSLFARTMFLTPRRRDELARHVPGFTVIAVPGFEADPRLDGTRTGTFIVISFADRMALIGGTAYAGEIKKTVFTVLNYLLPADGVLPMHCSANVGPDGDVALFFGLSGTGKTTLSADPRRRLIGDDEHGWAEDGVFNFEGGCYAKVIRLSAEHEPQIWAAVHRFGAILENVVWDPTFREMDLEDDRFTENTRAAYPLEFIPNVVPEKRVTSHPRNVVLLTCDAQGVLPPIARLSPEQAVYHFISGYTSKIAGTEVGLGIEPEITFSACFGAPFIVRHPFEYADMLRRRMERHGATCWLVNTGWVGGPFGVGRRISIRHTRALLDAALAGTLDEVEYRRDRLFGFEVPRSCPGVPDEVLDPSSSWGDREAYWRRYDALAARYIENFKLFAAGCPEEVRAAGPRRLEGSIPPA